MQSTTISPVMPTSPDDSQVHSAGHETINPASTKPSQPHEGNSSDQLGDPQHDIDLTIASLESQVDDLCGLLDSFRSNFESKLRAFHEHVENLPDRVGVAYNGRQRAHLLSMYGKSMRESSELALERLQHDLSRLAILGSDDATQLYRGYASTDSLLSSLQRSTSSSLVFEDNSSTDLGEQTAEPSGVVPSIVPSQRIRTDTPLSELQHYAKEPGEKSMSSGHHESAGDFGLTNISWRRKMRERDGLPPAMIID